jgi:hypothetical protein
MELFNIAHMAEYIMRSLLAERLVVGARAGPGNLNRTIGGVSA